MKQTQLYYALMLFFLVLCSCEDDIPLFPEQNEFILIDKIFDYARREYITNPGYCAKSG